MKGKDVMKRLFCASWGILIFVGFLSSSEAVVDRIVAVVNQEIITLSEVENRTELMQVEIRAEDRLEKREKLQAVRQMVLQQLIEEKLIDLEARKLGIKVTAKELEEAIDEIRKRNNLSPEEFQDALKKQGIKLEDLKKQMEKQILRTKTIRMSVKLESKGEEDELKSFYEKNVDQYRTAESFRPAHILFRIPKDATAEEILEIKRKAQKVLEKIRQGQDFGELAFLYSEDPSAKDRGGLGYFKKGEILPALEKEIARLRIGEVSGVIRTDFGFHIIKLLDRKGGTPLTYDEVKQRVTADYYQAEMEKALKQFLGSLKAKSVIDIRL